MRDPGTLHLESLEGPVAGRDGTDEVGRMVGQLQELPCAHRIRLFQMGSVGPYRSQVPSSRSIS